MAASLGADPSPSPSPSDRDTAAQYRDTVRSIGALVSQREHARGLLGKIAGRFQEIGAGELDPPELVRMIAVLERELRWVLDELDRVDEEQVTPRAHGRVAALRG